MDSNTHHHHHSYRLQQQQHHQPNSGLLRFRSAPSSLIANFTQPAADSAASVNKVNPLRGQPESQRLVSRFAGYGDSSNDTATAMATPSFQEFEDKVSKAPNLVSSALNRMNSQQGQGYSGLPPYYPIPRHGSKSNASSSAMDASYGLAGSMGMDHEAHQKSFSSSSLLRQSSSPAGFFSNNNICFQNGYATVKGVGSYGGVNGSNVELSPSITRLKNQISFSSRSPSPLGMLSQISEIGSEGTGATSPDDGRQGGSNDDARHYGPGFPYGSWNDTPQLHLSENLSGLKRGRSSNEKLFSDDRNEELGNQVHVLSHHLSLPKTSAEMVAMEKLLQFPDSVPCKIRAKRGCATHPRSIAERVRRTRISERMRKLQELVPNMDKQTNTADMLDLAVEYIKNLQKQFKGLSEKRANCKCISMQKADTNDQIA